MHLFMKTTFINRLIAPALLALATLNAQLSTVLAQGTTAFTFQGRLNTTNGPATGSYDMTFAVWDANVAGDLIAGPITNTAVAVSNGLFTATLNFGTGVFTGTNYWVEMAVSPAGAGTFVTLVPRQQLTPAPYAVSLVAPQSTALCPPGSVIAYMGTTAPPGWLMCDGTAYPTNQYPALFAVIGSSSGASGTMFNVPDCRGLFLRGTDNGRGLDPDTASRTAVYTGENTGDAVGSYQADQFRSHNHEVTAYNGGSFTFGYGSTDPNAATYGGSGNYPMSLTSSAGGNETRPVNVYVNYIIKY
jgi:microcystin-dependent protein